MERPQCIVCGNTGAFRNRFSKASGHGESFNLVQCSQCGLESIHPRPDETQIQKYYQAGYFTRRTDRGYNDYFSENIRKEIRRVVGLNLADLGFYPFEQSLGPERRALDIGCAAGYFVEYLRDRGWQSAGIDVSEPCIEAGLKNGLNVIQGNYLETNFPAPFDLVTLWATIEHLHHPDRVIAKAGTDLAPGGILLLSTCRTGGINFKTFAGSGWRYYNFPEHLFFFSKSTIIRLLEKNGFRVTNYATYGSGFGRPGSLARTAADHLAKRFNAGDMMILAARKHTERA